MARRAEAALIAQHRHLGRHIRGGEAGIAGCIAGAFSGVALHPGDGRPAGSVSRILEPSAESARVARWAARWRACSCFPDTRFRPSVCNITTAPKSAFLTGLTAVMVPLLGGARLSKYAAPQGDRRRPGGYRRHGIDDAAGRRGAGSGHFHESRRSADHLLRGLLRRAHPGAGPLFAHGQLRIVSTAQIGVSALLAWSLFHWMETPHIRWTAGVWVAIVITGLFATAWPLHFRPGRNRYTTSTRTALIFMLEPVFRLDHIVPIGRREPLAARGGGGRADPGGRPAGGDETVQRGGDIHLVSAASRRLFHGTPGYNEARL